MSQVETSNLPPYKQEQASEPSGSLWEQTQRQTHHALQCGALQSIPTDYAFIEQGGVHFLVRILSNLVRKEQATKKQQQAKTKGKDFNPFLPYEKDLFVTHLSPTHLCLLNKFNVVNHHLLIVTRAFEHQETWLNHNDFVALWMGLKEIDGLAFYNGGKTAGASQRHKHLQLIPMPLSPTGRAIPMEVLFDQTDTLPFTHGFRRLTLTTDIPTPQAAAALLDCYRALLQQMGVHGPLGSDRHAYAYNLLVTRRWMFLIPRIQENTHSISINALGFAGSLFVKDSDQLNLLKHHGPMNLLQNVSYSYIAPFQLSSGNVRSTQ